MNNLSKIIIAATGILSLACTKENTSIDKEESDQTYMLNLRFNVVNGVKTKAMNSADVPITDWVKRLDLYTYYTGAPELNTHYTIIPEAGDDITFHLEERMYESVYVLAFANLDPDTAEHYYGKSLDVLGNSNQIASHLVLEAGNFDFGKIPMVGSNHYTFYGNGEIRIDLYRIMSRIDIEKINIKFDDPNLLGKEVFVKNIVITNILNFYTPLSSGIYAYFGEPRLCFGTQSALANAFGGIETGYISNDKINDNYCNLSFDMKGPGKLNGSFRYEYNCNYYAEKGTLVADAPGILGQMTIQHYDNSAEEGLIVASGDMSKEHSFDVGKCFYTYYNSPSEHKNIVCDMGYQDNALKLVVELSINGKSWFYPIQLKYLQPNTVYQVKNITIKKLGSEYSNFYEKKIACDIEASVAPWEVVEVENIDAAPESYAVD